MKASPDTFYRWPAGPDTYLICDAYNYNTHHCFFCGDDLTHAEATAKTGSPKQHACYRPGAMD